MSNCPFEAPCFKRGDKCSPVFLCFFYNFLGHWYYFAASIILAHVDLPWDHNTIVLIVIYSPMGNVFMLSVTNVGNKCTRSVIHQHRGQLMLFPKPDNVSGSGDLSIFCMVADVSVANSKYSTATFCFWWEGGVVTGIWWYIDGI